MDVNCPHCSKELEASEELYGKTVSCPSCNKEFTIPNPKKSPVVAQQKNINVNIDIKRKGNPLGIAALVLGIIACLTCWIPIIGLFAIPMAAIGVILAIIGLIAALASKRTGFAFPVSGGIICVLAIVIAVASSGAFSIAVDNVVTSSKEKRNATNQKIVNDAGGQVVTPVAPKEETEQIRWVSASQVVQHGDLQLKLKSATVKRPKVQGTFDVQRGKTKELVLEIELKNVSTGKKINYRTWRDNSFSLSSVGLKDSFDNTYKRINYGYSTTPIGGVSSESIYPGKSINDVLIFEQPVQTIDWLHLELPCSYFGGEGFFRLEIPKSMINFDYKDPLDISRTKPQSDPVEQSTQFQVRQKRKPPANIFDGYTPKKKA